MHVVFVALLPATGSRAKPWERGYVFFACKGYREIIDGAVLSIAGLGLTSFSDCHSKPGQRPGNDTNLPCIGFCLPVVLAQRVD